MMDRLIRIIAFSLVMFFSFNVLGTPETSLNNQQGVMSLGLSISHIDPSIKAADDFYRFANGQWLDNTQIPAGVAPVGAYQQLVKQTNNDVENLIKSSLDPAFRVNLSTQKVANFFQSFLNVDAREKRGLAPLRYELAKIEDISNIQELAKYFAYANKYRFGGPFTLSQYADFHNPNSYMILTWQSGLGLPNSDDYLNQNKHATYLRERYFRHITSMFSLAGLNNSEQLAKRVIDLETELARNHVPIEQTRDLVGLYNKIPVKQLSKFMPNLAWNVMLKEAQLEDLDDIVLAQVDYMLQIDNLIVETELNTWKAYFKWSVINSLSPYLTKELEKARFEFFDIDIANVDKPQASWQKGVTLINQQMGDLVGKMYVEQHASKYARNKEMVNQIIKEIILAFTLSISEKNWLSEATKQAAKTKLRNMTVKVGYPDSWLDYSSLTIVADDVIGNIKRTYEFHYERLLDKQKVGRIENAQAWSTTPHTVNAYYNAPLNELVVPLAMLQPPYFHPQADPASNFGGIGAVIAHEISHALDDRGSDFDANGILRDWWPDKDKKAFSSLNNRLVAQYSQFEVLDDAYVNGELTLTENISDLVGINIATRAYLDSLKGQTPPVINGFTGIQRLFLSYAQSLAEHAHPRSLRQQLKGDPHSPNEFRVNGTLPHVPAFYEAFDVKSSDAMYLPPNQRVTIW